MVLMPPVSAISGTMGPSLAASARLIRRATSVEPVKATPATRAVRDQRRADPPVAERQMQSTARHPRLMQQLDRFEGDQRRLLGRLGDDAVAGHQRGGDLPGEDGEREIPRRNAQEHAAPAQPQQVRLAGRAGQLLAVAEQLAALGGVIAAEIHRLAQLRDGIVERAPALHLDQMDEQAAPLLQQVGGALQNGGAFGRRGRGPARKARLGGLHDSARVARIEFGDFADDGLRVDRA